MCRRRANFIAIAGIGPCLLALLLWGAVRAGAQEHPGMPSNAGRPAADGNGLFENRCALCHGPAGRAMHREALGKLGLDAIYKAITTGAMKDQAAGLTDEDRRAIANYLAGKLKAVVAPIPVCSGEAPDFPSAGKTVEWRGWSPTADNTRFQTGESAGLNAAAAKSLRLRWALVFPNISSLANQVTVAGKWMYAALQDGTIFSLDPGTGCTRWRFKADAGVRTAVQIEQGSVFFGDFAATVYAVDASSGMLRWKRKVEEHVNARITGAPAAFAGRLYVPVSSLEEGVAADPAYECCTFRGSVVALDQATGNVVWKTYTIPVPAKKQGVNSNGTEMWGPSGAAVWSSPTIDSKRGVLYVTTGNNYSKPESSTEDSVLAFDLTSGKIRWQRALHPNDIWNAACMGKRSANCPEDEGPDFDFGASAVLVRSEGARDVLLAGQKSGVLYALDPDRNGETLWEQRIGKGGSLGGILWGMASDGKRVYVAISDQEVGTHDGHGSLAGVDVATGKILWRTENPQQTCKDRPIGCSSGMGAPVTAIPDVVFAGSRDGHLRAYDSATGNTLWDFDTFQNVKGINGAEGHGGSIDAAGVTVANGFVYQTSGYAAYGIGMGGNVLLAFAPGNTK